MKINYGCGETKLKDYINIDIEESIKPDLVLDLRKQPFEYLDNSVKEIVCIHNVEHIEYKFHHQVLSEFWRVLVPNGLLVMAYPEFEKCSDNFLSNYRGMKDFWRATLYGRQLYPGDYHVTPMVTQDFIETLKLIGFTDIKHAPEVNEDYNTFLTCIKGSKPLSHEDLIRIEVFGKE